MIIGLVIMILMHLTVEEILSVIVIRYLPKIIIILFYLNKERRYVSIKDIVIIKWIIGKFS